MHATKIEPETRPDRDERELFTSDAYIEHFRPGDLTNPFHADYEAKRAWVVDSVTGRGQRILDVGGAMGRMAIPLARRHDVTLCDLSPGMLDLARCNADDKLKLAVADMRALPFRSGSFDYVLCIDVLPHLPVVAPGIAEIRRVMRKGGTLIIDSTNSRPFWTLAYPRYLGRRPTRWVKIWRQGGVLPEWSTRVRHIRLHEFKAGVLSAGFTIKTQRNFGPRAFPKWHVIVAEAA